MPRGLQRLPMRLVAAGASHSVAVSMDGRLFSWGNTDGGRRRVVEPIQEEGDVPEEEEEEEEEEEGSQLNGGGSSLLRNSRSSRSSRNNSHSSIAACTTLPPTSTRTTPSYVPQQIQLGGRRCFDIACGSWHTVIIVEVHAKDFQGAEERAQSIATSCSNTKGRDAVKGTNQVGVVWTWGNGRFGQLGRGMSPKVSRNHKPK